MNVGEKVKWVDEWSSHDPEVTGEVVRLRNSGKVTDVKLLTVGNPDGWWQVGRVVGAAIFYWKDIDDGNSKY